MRDPRSVTLAVPVIILLITLIVPHAGRAQQELRFSNSDYRTRVVSSDGTTLFVVDGRAPSIDDRPALPSRMIDIPLRDGRAGAWQLTDIEFDEAVDASPYYAVRFVMRPDSSVEEQVVPLDPALIPTDDAATPGVRSRWILAGRDGDVLRVEVPLLAWSPGTGVRWIRSFALREVQSVAIESIPRTTELPGSYAELSLLRYSLGNLDTSGTWIRHSESNHVLFVRNDGLHLLDKRWMQLSGIDTTGLDVSRVQVFIRGVEQDAVEIGLDDGEFGDGDGIAFHATRNYDEDDHRTVPADPEQPYPQYVNKYSDSTAVWVRIGDAPGRRAGRISVPEPASSDTVDWAYAQAFTESDRYLHDALTATDRKQAAHWNGYKTWWAGWQGGGVGSYVHTVTGLKTGIPGRAWIRIGSWFASTAQFPPYRLALRVNGSPMIDTTAFASNSVAVLGGSVDAVFLQEGENTLYLSNPPVSDGKVEVLVDWTELEYPSLLRAQANRLRFTVTDGMPTGHQRIRASGFTSSDIIAVRVRGAEASILPVVAVPSGSTTDIVFADTLEEGSTYVLTTRTQLFTSAVGRRASELDIRRTLAQGEYLVITARELQASADRYLDMIRREYSITGTRVLVEDIYDNYSYGLYNPEALKLFLYDAFRNWSVPPKYVLLLGDANLNLRDATKKYSRTLVPTYGTPVSDAWFIAFDSLSLQPQAALGRLPARDDASVDRYRERHERYLRQPKDLWNKTFLHFTGGDPALGESRLREYRDVNDEVIRRYIQVPPLAGNAVHLYKTITPPTDFGPYSREYVIGSIDKGALMISYLGHSGTQVWDNSIVSVRQLANSTQRSPLISDFGCSTGKFAEPDIVSFSELFLLDPDGQAIGYIGNAALGFESTSRVLPGLFYRNAIVDGITRIGDLHRRTKEELLSRYGNTPINRISVWSNTLIGDPIASLPLPKKPNLAIRPEWVVTGSAFYTDQDDSLRCTVSYQNQGIQTVDSVTVVIERTFGGVTDVQRRFRIPVPRVDAQLTFTAPVQARVGTHRITVTLDIDGELDEEVESDNRASIDVSVFSTRLRPVDHLISRVSGSADSLLILNPMTDPGPVDRVEFQFDSDHGFPNPRTIAVPYGRTVSMLSPFPARPAGEHTWWRFRLDLPGNEYIGPYSSVSGSGAYDVILRDSVLLREVSVPGLSLDNGSVTAGPKKVQITLVSAGFFDGSYGLIQFDGLNILPNTFFRNFYIAFVDSLTMQVKSLDQYDTYPDKRYLADTMAAMIERMAPGTLCVITTANEPWWATKRFDDAVRSIGGQKYFQMRSASSWCIIGSKGAAPGTVPESHRLRGEGIATVDTTYTVRSDTITTATGEIGPAALWQELRLERSDPSQTDIRVSVLGRAGSGMDTVLIPEANAASVDLSGIDAAEYPFIRVGLTFPSANLDAPRATISQLAVRFMQHAELALNYQSVSVTTPVVERGDSLVISADVLNAGEAPAGPFTVSLDLIDRMNIRRQRDSIRIAGAAARAWTQARFVLKTEDLNGQYQAVLHVDRNEEVTEQFEENNVFSTVFSVAMDTTRPALDILFDGMPVVDGDVVRPRPVIRLVLRDASPLKVTSPDAFTIVLNDSLIAMNGPYVRIVETDPFVTIEFTPVDNLEPGEHIFAFNVLDATGNKAYDEDLPVRVRVDRTDGIAQVYNYPNPFSERTDFTFVLTGTSAPESVDLKIYTIAGRLIRTLTIPPEALRIGYNVVRWDGRDGDGDRLANGTYFYKMVARFGASTAEHIGRIAVLR